MINLLSISAFSQINVIQFNSSWNEENTFEMEGLKDCETSFISICEYPEVTKEYDIKSVPTILIFDNGIEVRRFEANIMMEITCTRKEVQKAINEIMLVKFN